MDLQEISVGGDPRRRSASAGEFACKNVDSEPFSALQWWDWWGMERDKGAQRERIQGADRRLEAQGIVGR